MMKKLPIKQTLQNAWQIYRRDLRNIVHNPVALLVVGGLLLLPSLYAWVNIYACWDPYGNTRGIAVAVVNLDEGVSLSGNEVNAGDKIVDNLRENDAIGWQFVDLEQAKYGLLHDEYYAMLEIPPDFSATLVDVFDDALTKPEIIYRVNEKSNAIAPKITDSGAKTVTNQVTKAIIEVVDQAAFTVGNEVSAGLDQNQHKIKTLRDTVLTVNGNFAELESSLDQAQASLLTVEELLEATTRCLPELQDGVANLKDFSVQGNLLLADAQSMRQDGVDYLAEKFADCRRLVGETRDLLDEAQRDTDAVADLRDRVLPALKKADHLQEQLEEVLAYLETLEIKDPDYDAWLGKLKQADDLLGQLQGVLQQAMDNPEAVQEGLVTGCKAVNTATEAQLMALHKAKVQLELQLAQTTDEEQRQLLQTQLERTNQAITDTEALQVRNAAELAKLEAMTLEEVAAKIETLTAELTQLQTDLRTVIGVVEQLQASGVNYQTILQDLRAADGLLTDGLGTARQLLGTVDKGLGQAADYLRLGRNTLDEVDNTLTQVEQEYNQTWSGSLDAMFGDLQGSLNDLDSVLVEADAALPKVEDLLAVGQDGSAQGQVLLDEVTAAVPAAKAELARLSAVMAKLSDKNLNTLIDLMDTDTDAMSDYFSSPVTLKEERLYHLNNYGSAMTPFYTILAIWVGCLILSTLLITEAEPLREGEKLNIMEEYFGKYLTFLTISLLQSLIIALGDKYLLGVTVSNLPVFIGFCLFSSFVFVTIVYTIVSVFGTIGKAVCVVLLVLQIAGAGGTFPVEVMPAFYQALQPYLPFTYAIGALREAISGILLENLDYDFWHLLAFWVGAVVLGLALKRPLHPLVEWFNRKWKESGICE